MSTGAIPPTSDPGTGPGNVPPVPQPEPIGYAGGIETDSNAKTFGMLCHLLAFCALLGVPLGNIIGPLVMWLIKKDQYAFVNDQGKESLNFQITATIALIISGILVFAVIGIILLPIVGLAVIILTIIGTINASNGTYYRYPFNIRLIK